MAISFEKALGIREHSLMLRAERASILSSNLANADTPNFKAKDIDFQSELQRRMSSMETHKPGMTHDGHLDIGAESFSESQMYRLPTQPSIDGNTVESHVEHAEFMKNSMEFQVAFTLLNSSFKGITKALRGE